MKQAIFLCGLLIILFGCSKKNIVGEWKISDWKGQSYSVFTLEPKLKQTVFDDFAYALFTDRKSRLHFTKDLNFAFGEASSKHFIGKYTYNSDSSLNLNVDNQSLRFSILHESKDSIVLWTAEVQQIQGKDIKLILLR